MSFLGRHTERCVPILHLKIDVTGSLKELFRDDIIPLTCREVGRCTPILLLKIDVTSSFNEILREGLKPFWGLEVEWCKHHLVVDD